MSLLDRYMDDLESRREKEAGSDPSDYEDVGGVAISPESAAGYSGVQGGRHQAVVGAAGDGRVAARAHGHAARGAVVRPRRRVRAGRVGAAGVVRTVVGAAVAAVCRGQTQRRT